MGELSLEKYTDANCWMSDGVGVVECLSLTFRSCNLGVKTGTRQASNGHQNGGLVFSSSSTHTQPGKFSSPTQTVISLARGTILSLKAKTSTFINENEAMKIISERFMSTTCYSFLRSHTYSGQFWPDAGD